MSVLYSLRSSDTQVGFYAADGSAYTVAGNDVAFAPSQTLVFRFPTQLFKGAVLNSATLTLEITAKDPSVAGTSYHTIRAENTGDSDRLTSGALVDSMRGKTTASVAWSCVYPGGSPSSAVLANIDVKPLLLEVMALPDFQTGAYVTFFIKCDNENGTDNGVIMNNGFATIPTLRLDMTEPANVHNTVNMFQNAEFNDKLAGITTGEQVPFWGQNEFFGTYVPPANQGTLEVDTLFTRVPGVPVLKFTTGTTSSTARTGVTSGMPVNKKNSYIFCGWAYIPTNIPASHNVWCEMAFNPGPTLVIIPERGIWVPFCTNPFAIDTVDGLITMWPTFGIDLGYTGGWKIWISEPTFIKSTFRQMPFNALTPENNFIDHFGTKSRQQACRTVVPRTTMMVDGVPKRMPTWARRPNQNILELAEPIKGGPQIGQLPAGQTVGDLPTDMTVTELL